MNVDYESLDSLVEDFTPKLKRASRLRRNAVAGMEYDDIESEMWVTMLTVWRWSAKQVCPTQISWVFWASWNRRLLRLREQSRNKFLRATFLGTSNDVNDVLASKLDLIDPSLCLSETLLCLEKEVRPLAFMKAQGMNRGECMKALGITRREYYKAWEAIKQTLTTTIKKGDSKDA